MSEARILVVDDRAENLVAVQALLAPLGTPVVAAHSGEEALKHLLREDFAVVILDVEMPTMDGIETARLIRSREKNVHLPIIFVTAHSRDNARLLEAYAMGAIDYLHKPLEPEVLCAKVSFFVELHRRGQLIRQQAEELAERRRAEEDARRSSELEKQLAGIVGHDMRSPLSAILATAQIQLRKGQLAPEQRIAFERVERSAQRMQHIVNLLLDFTRARVGHGIPLEKAPCNLVELSRRVADEQQAIHPDRELHFDAPEPSVFGEWDAPRLSQVLSNMLDNAMKYGAPGTPVQVSVRESAGVAVLEVQNQGDPIPEERRAQLFEPFIRGASAHSSTSLGLGLFIIREIVRGHGGDVQVTSTREAGTCFRVLLPANANASAKAQPEPERARG